MAEFCLECWNKINKTNDPERKYIISEELDLCEECGQWTNVVIVERKYYYLRKFRVVIIPFKILYRILILPYSIYQYKKNKKASNYDIPSARANGYRKPSRFF